MYFAVLYIWPKLNQMPYLGSKRTPFHKIKSIALSCRVYFSFKFISNALNYCRHDKNIFRRNKYAQNIITFCTITFCVTFVYCILRQKLLHFALRILLHFASKVITFCVTITFCGKSYYILRYYYILCQLLQYVA